MKLLNRAFRMTMLTLVLATLMVGLQSANGDDSTSTRHVTYRLLAYNVGSAANIPLGQRQIRQIAHTIIDNDIDIAGLAEVELGTRWHDGRDHVAELCVALAELGYPMHVYKWPSFTLHGGWQTPALLSRYPIEASGYDVIKPPGGYRWCVGHITVNVAENTPVRAAMTHFWPQGDPAKQRESIAQLAAVANTFEGPRSLMGDFNMLPQSELFGIITETGLRSSCQVIHNRPCPTVDATAGVSGPLPRSAQIDYIVASEDVEFTDTYVDYYSMSDHWPIVAEVRVKANGPAVRPTLPDNTAARSPTARARSQAAALRRQHLYEQASKAYWAWEALCTSEDEAGFAAYSAACMVQLAGDHDAALESHQRVRQHYQDTEWAARAAYRQAFLYMDSEKFDLAEHAFRAWLDGYYTVIHPDEPLSPAVRITAAEIAKCQKRQGRDVSTHDVLESIARSSTTDLAGRSAAYHLAAAALAAGNTQQAGEWIKQANVPIRPRWIDHSKKLAEMYAAAGDLDQARAFHALYLDEFTDPLMRRVRKARWQRQHHADELVVKVPLQKQDITIDGDLTDWHVAPVARLDADAHGHRIDQLARQQNMAAELFLTASREQLYIGIRVSDRTHENEHSGQDLFRGDCLQVAIDPEADASKGYDEDDFELGFALTPAGVEQVVYYDRKGRSFDALDVAIQHDDDARIYEIAIPRTLLQQTNTGSGQMQRIGFNVLIGYGKGDDRYGWIDWTPGIGEEKSPMLYHTLVLPPIPE